MSSNPFYRTLFYSLLGARSVSHRRSRPSLVQLGAKCGCSLFFLTSHNHAASLTIRTGRKTTMNSIQLLWIRNTMSRFLLRLVCLCSFSQEEPKAFLFLNVIDMIFAITSGVGLFPQLQRFPPQANAISGIGTRCTLPHEMMCCETKMQNHRLRKEEVTKPPASRVPPELSFFHDGPPPFLNSGNAFT